MEGEVGLVAGRSQREKRRSYKDLLREEEIIDAEVRKTSKKQLKDTDVFFSAGEIHKKKKHYEDHLHRDAHSSQHRKRKQSVSESQRSLLPPADGSASPQTAMGLLQAITSPTAVGSDSPLGPRAPLKAPRRDRDSSSSRKQPQVVREGLPVVGEEVELEVHYAGAPDAADSSGSSSADDSECGKLQIQEATHTHSSSKKKKKKSKKSKKKKERQKKHSSRSVKRSGAANGSTEWSPHTPGHHSHEEKKKRREDGGKRKSKDKKKKVLTAYQIFYKEYRNSILEEHPGLDFGDLSKRLADAWKQLPEGDKQVWRERSEYLQRRQMKSDSSKHTKPSKQQQQQPVSRAQKDSSRVKAHHSSTPAGGAAVLKRQKKHSSRSVKRSGAANGSTEWSPHTPGHHSHEEKKKHYEDHLHRDAHSSQHRKRKRSVSESQRSLLPPADGSASPQTAMGLLQAITSPTAVGSDSPLGPRAPLKAPRRDRDSSSSRKQPQVVREGLPVVGEEVELEVHYAGAPDAADSSGSSSADDSECGKLQIQEATHTHSSSKKKKKKSKKSKKKKERQKKHSSRSILH